MTSNWTAKNPKALLKWACLFALFFGSSAVAQSDVGFRLSCKVMDNIVIEAEEGRSKRYTHYTDQFVVGDTLDVLVQLRPNDRLYLRLRDTLRDEVIVGTVKSSDEIQYYHKDMDYLSSVEPNIIGKFGLNNDSINIEKQFPINETLQLERYYKDDWHGQLVGKSHLTAQVAVLDCRASSQNNLAEITDRLKSIVKKWNE